MTVSFRSARAPLAIFCCRLIVVQRRVLHSLAVDIYEVDCALYFFELLMKSDSAFHADEIMHTVFGERDEVN